MTPAATRTDATVRILTSTDEWDAIESDWDALFASAPGASWMLDFTWLRLWWEIYGGHYGVGGLRVVTVWDADRLVGALPLYEGRTPSAFLPVRTLRLISTGEAEIEETCPDYLDVLCAPGWERAATDAVQAALGRMNWDYVELIDLSAQTPLLTDSPGALPWRTESRGDSYQSDLTGGFEAYLDRVSTSRGSHCRRLLRKGERAGARLDLATPDQCGAAFDMLAAMHQRRWHDRGHPGAFAAPRFEAFHRRLLQAWMPSGRAVLATLRHEHSDLAVIYALIAPGRCALYQSGVDLRPGSPLASPGILAMLMLMQVVAERGVTNFDFLRGQGTHKERLCTGTRPTVSIRLIATTPRGVAFRAAQAVAAGARRLRTARRGK